MGVGIVFVRLIKHWRGYKPGRVFQMPDGQANLLVHRGLAVRGGDPADALPTDTEPPARKPTKKKR